MNEVRKFIYKTLGYFLLVIISLVLTQYIVNNKHGCAGLP